MTIKLTLMTLMAMQYSNEPYKWGANGPWEFDCSGFVLKVLRDVGFSDLEDMTAAHIYKWASHNFVTSSQVEEDCLLFFGNSLKHITHVGIAVSKTHFYEAGGAGKNSLRMNDQQLAALDARVRIKPLTHRRDLLECIKVKY